MIVAACDKPEAKPSTNIEKDEKADTAIDETVAEVEKEKGTNSATPQGSVQGTPQGTKKQGNAQGGSTATIAVTKPVVTSSAPWGTVVTFPKVAGHTYTLKEEKTGVTLSESTGNRKQITATQSARGVIIVATFDGTTSESEPLEFTRKKGNGLSFATESVDIPPVTSSATHTQTATNDGTVAGDTRNIRYSISPIDSGATIDPNSGAVTLTRASAGTIFTITAELQEDAKYTRSPATYTLIVEPLSLVKPVLTPSSAEWGTVITFPKLARYTYTLKEEKTGVTLSESTGNRMQLTATQSAEGVIVVATFNGRTSESEPLEFTRKQGNTVSFTTARAVITLTGSRQRHTQTATPSKTVAGDTRNILYSITPTGLGVTIDSGSGEVTVSSSARQERYTVTAELEENEKYTRSRATYTLNVCITRFEC